MSRCHQQKPAGLLLAYEIENRLCGLRARVMIVMEMQAHVSHAKSPRLTHKHLKLLHNSHCCVISNYNSEDHLVSNYNSGAILTALL